MPTRDQTWHAEEIAKLRDELTAKIRSGATTEEIDQWADAYTFGRRDCIEVIRLLVGEAGGTDVPTTPHTIEIVDDLLVVLDQDGNGCDAHLLRSLQEAKRQLRLWQDEYTFDYAGACRPCRSSSSRVSSSRFLFPQGVMS